MSKTNDILAHRMRRIEQTMKLVAETIAAEGLLHIKIRKEQARVMGKMRSDEKPERVIAMLALVRHHCELGVEMPNVNANEANGFAGDPEKFEKRRIPNEELRKHTYEDASGLRTCLVQRYEYCVCEARPHVPEWTPPGYDLLRGELTFRELNSAAEAMEIAFAGNGVYAFRHDTGAQSKTWELISPVRKEIEEDDTDEKMRGLGFEVFKAEDSEGEEE